MVVSDKYTNMEDDMAPRYRVTLTKEGRKDMEAVSTQGKGAVHGIVRSRIAVAGRGRARSEMDCRKGCRGFGDDLSEP